MSAAFLAEAEFPSLASIRDDSILDMLLTALLRLLAAPTFELALTLASMLSATRARTTLCIGNLD
jgi:hypothetical protein